METQEWEAAIFVIARGLSTPQKNELLAFIKKNFVSKREIEKVCEEIEAKAVVAYARNEEVRHEAFKEALSDLRRRLIETS